MRPPRISPIDTPIWTENKARFIERYLRYFVLITQHGTYIDGFAGPQAEAKPETWAAKLVLESEPRRLRNFFLFEKDKGKVEQLRDLKKAQRPAVTGEATRRIEVRQGDFNSRVHEILTPGIIKETEATFCLLDQRTFECEWRTVAALAHHKKKQWKIELFYFLANWWLDRALRATTTQAGEREVAAWWGRDDWRSLATMQRPERVQAFLKRFRELGYRHVTDWPIFDHTEGQRVMYFMIHASDHAKAPELMRRAYANAVRPPEHDPQLSLLE